MTYAQEIGSVLAEELLKLVKEDDLQKHRDKMKADWEEKHPNMPYNPKDFKAGTHHWGPKGTKAPAEPKPVVTGPGHYKARNGKRVVIASHDDKTKSYSGHGIKKEPGEAESHRERYAWTKHGSIHAGRDHELVTGRNGKHSDHPWDIVGPWK